VAFELVLLLSPSLCGQASPKRERGVAVDNASGRCKVAFQILFILSHFPGTAIQCLPGLDRAAANQVGVRPRGQFV
jgi:hypothetical protein